jgi:hypothetical protein
MLSKHTSPGLPPRLGRGFSLSSLSADDVDYYRDRLAGVIRYLGHHKPWLLKVRHVVVPWTSMFHVQAYRHFLNTQIALNSKCCSHAEL